MPDGASSVPRSPEVWEQVLDELRLQIILGELAPGAKLIETELAHQFGTSRGPVRTALLNLERSGLVVSSARRGVEVARYTSIDIAELYTVRIALETLAAREAATRCSAATIERLDHHLDLLEAVHAEHAPFEAAEHDLAFHEEILVSSGNRLLLEVWANLADRLAVVMTRVHHDGVLAAEPGGSHRDIVAALAANDRAAAEKATRSHLAGALRAAQLLSAAMATSLAS